MRPRRTTRQRVMPAVADLVVACTLLWGCASPIPDLWPPTSNVPARTIYVSLDTWHAVIALPQGEESATSGEQEEAPLPQAQSSSPPSYRPLAIRHSLFEEWGYAERAWYLEDRRGLTGILRALFWPTEGVVEIGQYDRVWADRTPQPPSDLFLFRVSEEGYRRLRRHLRSTVSSDTPVASLSQSTFYSAVRSYHLFHTCHQYAASALHEAGLPISAFWAFNRTSLAWQLRRTAHGSSGYAEESSHIEPDEVTSTKTKLSSSVR